MIKNNFTNPDDSNSEYQDLSYNSMTQFENTIVGNDTIIETAVTDFQSTKTEMDIRDMRFVNGRFYQGYFKAPRNLPISMESASRSALGIFLYSRIRYQHITCRLKTSRGRQREIDLQPGEVIIGSIRTAQIIGCKHQNVGTYAKTMGINGIIKNKRVIPHLCTIYQLDIPETDYFQIERDLYDIFNDHVTLLVYFYLRAKASFTTSDYHNRGDVDYTVNDIATAIDTTQADVRRAISRLEETGRLLEYTVTDGYQEMVKERVKEVVPNMTYENGPTVADRATMFFWGLGELIATGSESNDDLDEWHDNQNQFVDLVEAIGYNSLDAAGIYRFYALMDDSNTVEAREPWTQTEGLKINNLSTLKTSLDYWVRQSEYRGRDKQWIRKNEIESVNREREEKLMQKLLEEEQQEKAFQESLHQNSR